MKYDFGVTQLGTSLELPCLWLILLVRVLYTGDYSREEDCHLCAAEIPQFSLYFNSEKMVKTIRRLAEKTPEVGETVSGFLVKKAFTYQIMALDDLHFFSQLSTENISHRITIAYSGAFGVLKHRQKQIFESVESLPDEESEGPAFRVHERLTVKYESEKHISLHWRSDPISDMVSDSVIISILLILILISSYC